MKFGLQKSKPVINGFRIHFEAASHSGGMSLLIHPNAMMFCCTENAPDSEKQKAERIILKDIALDCC